MPEIAVKTQKAKSGFFVKTCPLFPLEPKSSKKENRKNVPVILVKTWKFVVSIETGIARNSLLPGA